MSQSKFRRQLQRSRRSFNKGLMWALSIFFPLVKYFFLAAARGLQPAAPDAVEGAGDAQWHPQRGRHSKHIHSHVFAEISWTDPSESCKILVFRNISRRKCINWNIFWCKYLLAAAMHELRRNGPPVVAVPGQAKRHQQHSVHKVGFKIFKCLKFKYFSAITKNLQRCGGAGHTTGDCMVNFHFFLHQCQVSANAKTDLKSANLFRLVDLGIKYLLAQDQELSPPTSGAHLDRWVRYPCLFLP